MKDHDVNDISSFIVYLDANNLYGHAMIQKLPYGKFEWYDFKIKQIEVMMVTRYIK